MAQLVDLGGLRTAPILDSAQRQALMAELEQCLAACDWFTIGVMAPSANAALASLRAAEARLHWQALVAAEPNQARETDVSGGPVFLKGNQSTGSFNLRQEAGLGEGILITGQAPGTPAAEGTWGPLPLDFFSESRSDLPASEQ